MAYYKDLRDYLQALEKRGRLARIKSPINKDTQLHPLVRLQFRGLPEEKRKAFLFESVVDSKGKRYDGSVVVCALAGSTEILSIGMMCEPKDITEKLARAEAKPVTPKIVNTGPVQEEIHVGGGLLQHGGLEEFPIPISTPGYDIAPYMTSPCWVTKDPETGIRNVGTYRAQLKSPTRCGINFSFPTQQALIHWRKCKERGIPLQAAIVIGGPPSVGYVGVSKLPYGLDEFAVAGGIAGEALSLVKCQTVDIEVPATAEVVIEGELTTEELEPEAPFGEATGFVGPAEIWPYFTVKCITHRKRPVWLAFLSQFPPSESSKIREHVNEGTVFQHLRNGLGMSYVLDVACHEPIGADRLWVVKLAKTETENVWRALEALKDRFTNAKFIIAVSEDIDARDPDAVNWSLCFRALPHRDCRVVKRPESDLMDPSLLPIEELDKLRAASLTKTPEGSCLLMDATLKWAYPPVSLPKKEFMEEALRLWKKEKLPELKLKEPWFGYNLGYWTAEDDKRAEAAVKGDYQQYADEQAKRRRKA